MATMLIGVTPSNGGKSFRVTNLTGAVPLAGLYELNVKFTGSLSGKTFVSGFTTSNPEFLTAKDKYLDIDYFGAALGVDDFYKVEVSGRDAAGNILLTSNIDAVFTSSVVEAQVRKKMLSPVDLTDKGSMNKRLARALVLIEGLRILQEDLSIDKEISVIYRLKLLKRDFQ